MTGPGAAYPTPGARLFTPSLDLVERRGFAGCCISPAPAQYIGWTFQSRGLNGSIIEAVRVYCNDPFNPNEAWVVFDAAQLVPFSVPIVQSIDLGGQPPLSIFSAGVLGAVTPGFSFAIPPLHDLFELRWYVPNGQTVAMQSAFSGLRCGVSLVWADL